MAVGSSQQLSFFGTAVHGGGSCQLSLTTDNPPTKGSKWQVIHSIEGGCPAKNQAGNLDEKPGDPRLQKAPDTYDYKIPDGIKAGPYTFAWTWFNKVGNREMYMNCALVKITGGASKRDELSGNFTFIPELHERDTSFPDMFKANIGNQCTTAEGGPLAFPDPGASVDKFNTDKPLPPTGSCAGGSSGGSAGASSGASSGAGAGASAGSANAAAAPSGSSSGASAPSPSGVDVESSPSSGSGASSPSGASAPASSGSAPTQQQNTSSAGSGGTAAPQAAPATQGAATPSGSTSCTQAGAVICSADAKQIGTCDQSMKVVMIPVPQGTICKNGNIAWPSTKRSRIYKNGAVRRQLHVGGWHF
ncbi:uncharacterized protein KY384_005337 [Bacidia gigantensis]|uniref:uncharacterized protein n=1 Tax=Bacidia gigantensis TaxID=2732470 RepID=UPI001D041917|nr:uncharacterized protein KY384_005337 [Bacidia gigantensis]KAG8529856.1 hypothetical protein KY384_005337 [Bacidia gigantensis]